jgi:hypothetical protein
MNDKVEPTDKEEKVEAKAVRKDVSPDNEALVKFGEQQIINSADALNKFSQSLVTLDSGLFAVYFAILKFLGIETVGSTIPISTNYIALPPVLFILSLVAFVISIVPIYSKISLVFPTEIKEKRNKILLVKYLCIISGVVLLVSSLAITIDVYVKLLTPPDEDKNGNRLSSNDTDSVANLDIITQPQINK